MHKPPKGPDLLDEIDAILEDSVCDVLRDVEDPRVARRAQRYRVLGLMLLGSTVACIAGVAYSLQEESQSAATLALGCAAILLLLAGGWSVDQGGKIEIRASRDRLTNEVSIALSDADESLMLARIRRRRFLGYGLWILSAFCMAVAATPVPGKQVLDSLMWAGFSVALIIAGALQLRTATGHAVRAQALLESGRRRQQARKRGHIKLVRK
jgi:hypothetical protein